MKVIREFQKEGDVITIVGEKSKMVLTVEEATECEKQLRRALGEKDGNA
jgi:hypothetical protein